MKFVVSSAVAALLVAASPAAKSEHNPYANGGTYRSYAHLPYVRESPLVNPSHDKKPLTWGEIERDYDCSSGSCLPKRTSRVEQPKLDVVVQPIPEPWKVDSVDNKKPTAGDTYRPIVRESPSVTGPGSVPTSRVEPKPDVPDVPDVIIQPIQATRKVAEFIIKGKHLGMFPSDVKECHLESEEKYFYYCSSTLGGQLAHLIILETPPIRGSGNKEGPVWFITYMIKNGDFDALLEAFTQRYGPPTSGKGSLLHWNKGNEQLDLVGPYKGEVHVVLRDKKAIAENSKIVKKLKQTDF